MPNRAGKGIIKEVEDSLVGRVETTHLEKPNIPLFWRFLAIGISLWKIT